MTAPAMVLRTGSAVPPAPRCRASRTPITGAERAAPPAAAQEAGAGGGPAAPAGSRAGRSCWPTARHDGQAAQATVAASTVRPGPSGQHRPVGGNARDAARRCPATPTGNSGDSAERDDHGRDDGRRPRRWPLPVPSPAASSWRLLAPESPAAFEVLAGFQEAHPGQQLPQHGAGRRPRAAAPSSHSGDRPGQVDGPLGVREPRLPC